MTRREFLGFSAMTALGRWCWEFGGVFEEIVAKARANGWRELPIGALMGEIGKSFFGTPYIGQTLETSDTVESCVVNLAGLDCVTFFESSLGLARMLKLGGDKVEDLIRQITLTRYRSGVIDGYVSRLHYTCEWFADNAKKGTIKDITAELPGSASFEKKIDFMSTHPDLYRQLRANPSWIPAIAEIEKRLSGAPMIHLPKGKISRAEAHLQTGDIVGMTTSVEGIDCSHTGLCCRDANGALRFLHASSTAGKVVLGPRLSDYVRGNSKSLGVMIARPLEAILK